jgi:hypothetical protein
MNKRPLSVLLIACLYIAVGAIGFVYHSSELLSSGAFHYDGVLVEITELTALVCGVFMLRGQNWARWLAIVWIGFHVLLSAFHAFQGFAVHCALFILIAWAIFRPDASSYFGGTNRSA